MIGERHNPKPTPQAPAFQPTGSDTACPRCGSGIPTSACWCPSCGLQAFDPCWECGRALREEAGFCAYCGTPATEPGVLQCGACSGIVGQGQGYCPQCGAQARPVCSECDRPLRSDWQSCPRCGGEPIGTEEAVAVPHARAEVQAELEAEPEAPWSVSRPAERLNRLGTDAYEGERYDEAVRYFREAVDADPNNSGYWTNLGVAYSAMENDTEALLAYRRATELNANEISAFLFMGQLYLEREKYTEAREAWEQVVRIDPDSQEAEEARENLRSLEDV